MTDERMIVFLPKNASVGAIVAAAAITAERPEAIENFIRELHPERQQQVRKALLKS